MTWITWMVFVLLLLPMVVLGIGAVWHVFRPSDAFNSAPFPHHPPQQERVRVQLSAPFEAPPPYTSSRVSACDDESPKWIGPGDPLS